MPIPKSFGDMVESKYLKKEDVGEDGLVVTVIGFRKENMAMEGQPEEQKWIMGVRGMSISGEPLKPMVMGSTNIQALQKATGAEDPAGTIGKKIVVYEDPNVTMMGKTVGGVRIRKVSNRDVGGAAPVPTQFDEMDRVAQEADAQRAPRPSRNPVEAAAGPFEDDIPF